ncbi:MAG: thiamine pyrophosphate-binding protein [Gammaproteobacteria bacterium]|nr:thiamine pyrophosphate-binding protein [Gammaproteobacteria bacterium]
MRGRIVFMEALRVHGVRAIFGNPGTTESPLLDSLLEYPEIRYITTLHEGIAVSAAVLYAQATGETVVANVHVAPGLGNALGSLYGAMKSCTPLLMTAGQQDTRLRLRDPVLGHDLVAMAAPLVKWSTQVTHADEMAAVMQRAMLTANEAPKGPVFVSLPINVMEQETAKHAWATGPLYTEIEPDLMGIEAAAQLLAAAQRPVIVTGDDVARAGAAPALLKLAERLGAPVFQDTLRQHVVLPNRHPAYGGLLPLDATAIRAAFGETDAVLMLGGPFFEELWYDPRPAIPEGAKIVQLAHCSGVLARNFELSAGIVGALGPSITALDAALSGKLPAASAAARLALLAQRAQQRRNGILAALAKTGNSIPMSSLRAVTEIAAGMSPEAVVVDESITATGEVAHAFDFKVSGDYFGQRGGGIGQGIAGALGVAVAMPGRPVVAISGDGSAMYAIQSLWTAALLRLPIVFVILANHEYRVLKHNIDIYRQRFDTGAQQLYPHMDLTPRLDFTALAQGMGVVGERVEDPAQLAAAVKRAIAAGAPRLIEVTVAGKQ